MYEVYAEARGAIMISYEAIIAQIEQAVQQAKHAHSEQQMREQLTAVKALCEVVLGQQVAHTTSKPVQQMTAVQPASVQVPVMQQANTSSKLQEPDANGDSIFDF